MAFPGGRFLTPATNPAFLWAEHVGEIANSQNLQRWLLDAGVDRACADLLTQLMAGGSRAAETSRHAALSVQGLLGRMERMGTWMGKSHRTGNRMGLRETSIASETKLGLGLGRACARQRGAGLSPARGLWAPT